MKLVVDPSGQLQARLQDRSAGPERIESVLGQRGTAADVAGAFDERGLGAIVNNSRGILFAYRREPYSGQFGEARWQEAVEAATRDMIAQLAADTPAGRLGSEYAGRRIPAVNQSWKQRSP